MLKTNSKKAKENIQKYILNNFTPEGYTENPPQEWHEIAAFILDTFRNEKYSCLNDFKYYRHSEIAAFNDWTAGLPGLFDPGYYYKNSAVDELGELLEETEEEKSRYNETQAENLLSYLIYRELKKGASER